MMSAARMTRTTIPGGDKVVMGSSRLWWTGRESMPTGSWAGQDQIAGQKGMLRLQEMFCAVFFLQKLVE